MIPALREAFNRDFLPETYQQFLKSLEASAGTPIAFRVSETPCFLPKELLDQMADYGRDLVLQLVNSPGYLRASDVTVPWKYNVANESPRPMFLQVDFGLVRNAQGELEPKLVELQAFPSLYAYQPVLAQQYIESYALPAALGIYLGGLDHDTYQQQMRELIVAGHDPENVILLEIHPEKQKTLCDFIITQKDLGIAIVDILDLKKRGERLFYKKGSREIPVDRIYNRCIVDELERKGIELPFDLTQPLDVEWAGHPNWYYRISKFSIPYLKHRCVPRPGCLPRQRGATGQRQLRIEAAVFLCRAWYQVQSYQGGCGCHPRRAAPALHAPGTYAFRACDRDAARDDPGRNSHYVRVARGWRDHTCIAAAAHGPRHHDGRRSQPQSGMGGWIRGVVGVE